MAFMGLPCPTNITGILSDGDKLRPSASKADNVLIPENCAKASKPPAFNIVRLCMKIHN